MTDRSFPRPLSSQLEVLEQRVVPTAQPWHTEAFDSIHAINGEWARWSDDPSATFEASASDIGHDTKGSLLSTAKRASTSRAWLRSDFSADVSTSIAVHVDSPIPVEVFVRGQALDTTAASYYSASVVQGGIVQLNKVVHGTVTTLATVQSQEAIQGEWLTLRMQASGQQLTTTVTRQDGRFLQADGTWKRTSANAIQLSDNAITNRGQVGFNRTSATPGIVKLDDWSISPATSATETPPTTTSTLPADWLEWSSNRAEVQQSSNGALHIDTGSQDTARVWASSATQADVQVSTSLYLDSLSPSGVFARGQQVDTDQASYYSLTLRRGLEAELWRVKEGVSVSLGTVHSNSWVSSEWIQATLVATGSDLRVQLYRPSTGEYLRADGDWSAKIVDVLQVTDSTLSEGGQAGLTRQAGYAGKVTFDNFALAEAIAPPINPTPTVPPVVTPTNPNPSPTPTNTSRPDVPHHYDWIRLANLAYYGTPLGDFEQSLLRNSVDLVIPNSVYIDDIAAISPDTPQFIYTNISNIYLGLVTDWNRYADTNGLNRESAFYHVNTSTPYNGLSASAIPVEQFWSVKRGSDATGWTDQRGEARNPNQLTSFPKAGESLAIGYPEKFREIDLHFRSGASNGYAGQWEYVSATNAQGAPTAWKTLNINSDSSSHLRRDGKIQFDPPRDWVASSLDGGASLFHLRFRATNDGTTPVASSILGRDYTFGGKIPAFDANADRDGDGYLNDQEYAQRAKGQDARFFYESRLFYPNYGPHRYATNVSDPGFRAWATDYHVRLNQSQESIHGFFVDNSIGRLAVDHSGLKENLEGYSNDYGSLLGSLNKQLAATGSWLIANTAGGNTTATPIIRNGVSYLEEFALRPMTANHVQFDDLNATLNFRREISGNRNYEILDSLPQGRDANDPRVQMTTLAMYYAVADSKTSFLMLNGGNEPASGWDRHWIDAITYNVGQAKGANSVLAEGFDPSNSRLAYKVYQRDFDNAKVLYKPLSYTRGTTGTTADNTATTHQLEGWYRVVNADGSMGQPVRSVSLRNGEGVVLARV